MPLTLLRPPDFGNRFRFIPNTRFHRTLSGELRMLQGDAPIWQGFFGHHSALTQQQVTDFRNWVITNFGRQTQLIDFENRLWTGIIVSPSIPIFSGRDACSFQTEFEFEGSVVQLPP